MIERTSQGKQHRSKRSLPRCPVATCSLHLPSDPSDQETIEERGRFSDGLRDTWNTFNRSTSQGQI